MEYQYAKRAQNLKASDIRELLKLAHSGKVTSFAGGSPDASLFPLEAVKNAARSLIDTDGAMALQYGPTEGYMPLRKLIVENRMPAAGVCGLEPDTILVTNGSQQGLDLIARALLEKGDSVVVERPTYSGAINAFRAYECRYQEVEMDSDGMRMDLLENILKTDNRVKFIYCIPDFQNPSGRVMSLEKRKELLRLAEKYGVPIVEDGPYSEIAFEEKLPSIKSLDQSNIVFYNGSFSKIFSPGIRVAWICADPAFIRVAATLKQGTDLQGSSFDQRLVAFYMQQNDINESIHFIKEEYRKKRDAMMGEISKSFPEEVSYVYPKGGFFTWLELREDLTAHMVLDKAKEEGVIFVPGRGFFANGSGENYARLSYVTVSEEKIIDGMKRLGNVLKTFYSK